MGIHCKFPSPPRPIQLEPESASFSLFAVHVDLSTVGFNRKLTVSQAQACRILVSRFSALHLTELLEDPAFVLGGNAGPLIVHRNTD